MTTEAINEVETTSPKKPAKAAPTKDHEIQVVKVTRSRVTFNVLGTTPMLYNSMNAKVMRDLLLPPKAKTKADKAVNLKHDPIAEFRRSIYFDARESAPTLLTAPSTAFKKALACAAIDIPGDASKAQVGRLAFVEGYSVHVYGIPQVHMGVVRMADASRTPDVRTRAILPEWCCQVTVTFIRPMLNERAITNLMAGAGITQGIGDFRIQKGAGSFGSFDLVGADDERFQRIVAEGGRAAQIKAMDDAEPYDGETAELLSWFLSEAKARDFKSATQPGARRAS